jgi:hypothetical protein
VSMCKKSTARMPLSCWLRNCDHVGPTRRGAGPIPAECRIRHTVDEARCDVRANQLTLGTPMAPARVLLAIRTTSCRIAAAVGGRPGPRRAMWSHLRATSFAMPHQQRRWRHREHRGQPQPVDAPLANSTHLATQPSVSWRNTNNSTPLDACRPRITTTAPSNHRTEPPCR